MTVAEELHFGRAAARLHIAQPSLSQQIRLLERQLGVALLERTSRRVELTPAGRVLAADGRRLLAQAGRVARATVDAASERLTVGFHGTAGAALLPAVLRAFGERHPAIDVSVREVLFGQADDVLAGVDVAFTRLLPEQADLEIEVLAREPRVVALAATHPLAGRAALAFADLRDERFIVNPVLAEGDTPSRWLAEQHRHGLPGRVAARATSLQEVLMLVAAQRGAALVPTTVARLYPREDIRYVTVSDADPAVVSLAWSRGPRPAVQAFVDTARQL